MDRQVLWGQLVGVVLADTLDGADDAFLQLEIGDRVQPHSVVAPVEEREIGHRHVVVERRELDLPAWVPLLGVDQSRVAMHLVAVDGVATEPTRGVWGHAVVAPPAEHCPNGVGGVYPVDPRGDLADPVALDLPGLGVDRDEAIGDGLVEPEGDLVGAGSPERTPLIVDLESPVVDRGVGVAVAPHVTLKQVLALAELVAVADLELGAVGALVAVCRRLGVVLRVHDHVPWGNALYRVDLASATGLERDDVVEVAVDRLEGRVVRFEHRRQVGAVGVHGCTSGVQRDLLRHDHDVVGIGVGVGTGLARHLDRDAVCQDLGLVVTPHVHAAEAPEERDDDHCGGDEVADTEALVVGEERHRSGDETGDDDDAEPHHPVGVERRGRQAGDRKLEVPDPGGDEGEDHPRRHTTNECDQRLAAADHVESGGNAHQHGDGQRRQSEHRSHQLVPFRSRLPIGVPTSCLSRVNA